MGKKQNEISQHHRGHALLAIPWIQSTQFIDFSLYLWSTKVTNKYNYFKLIRRIKFEKIFKLYND